jgi:uncharacterized oligopeptide transporter (OPT) family protein
MMTLTHLAISGLMTGLVLGNADPVVWWEIMGCVMLQFFAIGTDSKLLNVIAGMSGALLLGLTYVLRILPKDSRRVS